jgi:DNA-directed RNA polymerase subunit N (RpoN/RPB10)
MKINCLGCGLKVDLAANYDDYEGQIKCFACGAIMEISTQEANVRAVRLVTETPLPSAERPFERNRG